MVTVAQLAPRPIACTYVLSMSPTGFTANAASGTFSVSTDSNCVWGIEAPSWVSLSSTNGTGAYAGTFTVDANMGLSRTGLVTVTGGETDISCSLTQQALVAGAAALIIPLDGATLQNLRPQFSWSQSDPAATNYYLVIDCGGSNYLAQWSGGATNWTSPTDLPAGTYTWAVEAWNSGEGVWSTNSTFTIQAAQAAVPNMIALLSPSGVVNFNVTQRYTWTADPAATSYELYIEMDGNLFLDQWFTLTNSVVDISTGDFAVDLSWNGRGTYLWWVRGWSPAGYGPWSDCMKAVLYHTP